MMLWQKSIDRNGESNPGSQTPGLLFNVRALYQLSYPSRIQIYNVMSKFVFNYPSVISYMCAGGGVVHVGR